MKIRFVGAALAAAVFFSAGALSDPTPPVNEAEYGPHPVLPAPDKHLIPTLHVAKAEPWKGDAMPRAAPGLKVAAVARGLQHPRWLYVLPNGDVLVAESEAPPKPDDSKGISGKIHAEAMKRAGSGTHSSANRITLLRYVGGDPGRVEQHVFLHDLNSPIGMALVGDSFYVADSDALLRV